MKYRIAGMLLLSSLLLIYSCRDAEEKIPDLRSIVWIYSTDHLPDSMNYVEGNYLVFDSSHIFFNNHFFGQYLTISDDTLTIAWDDEKKQIVFEGIIQRQTADSLILKRLKGGFPIAEKSGNSHFDRSEYITFFNQRLVKKNPVPFETLSFSASSCYGVCPEIACEIDNQGNIKFHGGVYADKEGYFVGKVNKEYYNQIKEIVSYASMKYDTIRFSIPTDVPVYHLLIEADNKNIFYEMAYSSSYKMDELVDLLIDISAHSQLHETKEKIGLKVEYLFLPDEFLPPVSETLKY